MEERFFCFESDAFLFLIPLDWVGYILPASEVRDGLIAYGASMIRAVPFRRLWSREKPVQDEIHTVICQNGAQSFGMIVKQALGVMTVPETAHKELPRQVRGGENRFITGAAYLEDLGRWAYVIDPGGIMPETEGIYDEHN